MTHTMKSFIAGTALAVCAVAVLVMFLWRIDALPADNTINHCTDGVPAQYDATGALYGDQNNDGKLSGMECDYR